jgi:hypothetical protein
MRSISSSNETSHARWGSRQSLDGRVVSSKRVESWKRVANRVGGFNPEPVVSVSGESSSKIAQRSGLLGGNSSSGLTVLSGEVDGVGGNSGTTIISGIIPANLDGTTFNLREVDVLRSRGSFSDSGSRSGRGHGITSSVEGLDMEVVGGSLVEAAELMMGSVSRLGD